MNYKRQLKSFNLNTVATISLVMFLVSFIAFSLINLSLENKLLLTGKVYLDVIISILMLAVLLVIHELLHAISAVIFGKLTFKDIKLGANLKQGMIYCHIKKPLKINAYRISIILPIIITGIIPLVISAIFGNLFLVAVFSFMVSGGAGDIVMFFSLSGIDSHTLIEDHPKALAYYLLYENGKEPKNFIECTKEQQEEVSLAMQGGKSTIKVLLIAIFCGLVVLVIYLSALLMKIF
ncbi:MAG: DUF3267 domain-containing protein [Clostridiales bacterium]|nr:DUF3267 domain-containing protein [Clostridiales bacterium]